MKFRDLLEKKIEFGDLQVAYNKYKFNLDQGNDSEAKSWKKKVDDLWKTLSKRDIEARNASGKRWSDILNEEQLTEAYSNSIYTVPKKGFTKVFNKWVEDFMGDVVPMAGGRLAYTNQAGEIVFLYDEKTEELKINQRGLDIEQLKSYGLKGVKEEINYANIIRYIPTGSKVRTELTDKSLKISIIYQLSTSPLFTKDISNIDRRLRSDVDLFIKDVEGSINLKDVVKDDYIAIMGVNKGVNFQTEFTLYVGNKSEGKKLVGLDNALEFKKKYKLDLGE